MSKLIKIKKNGFIKIGFLSFLERQKDINFDIKRIYYIYQVPKGIIRGHHAHKELNQLLIALNGKIKVILDNGQEKTEHILTDPSQGLFVGKGIWRTMEWLEDNAILLVLASEYYDEKDYIRDYDEFIKMVKDGYWKGVKDTFEFEEKREKIDKELLDAFRKKHALFSKNLEDILSL